MLVLFETSAGYALFKVLDKGKLKKADDIWKDFQSPDAAAKLVKLKAFSKFEDTDAAVAAASAICDGKLDKALTKFLKKSVDGEKDKLAVIDKALGGMIKEKTGIKCVHDNSVSELIRGIRSQIDSLLVGISKEDSRAFKLGLSHSLGRYKLKFSPDKVDVMIIQAIALLDELDKELNTYSMRVREWYGWHFPEMGKIVTDNQQYAKVVKKMGMRQKASDTDMSDILEEDTETEVKAAAEVSMGTEISEQDIDNMTDLCDQVISISTYRTQLWDYLRNRMNAIAPNLTCMVGELVGARLIAHAGSLMSLAKHPASTVQILGAEKALFRALKTKHDTPKYGLIYHASLVGQAAPKHKGKISRVLAAKTSLSARMDALGDTEGVTIGAEHYAKVENRLRELEGGVTKSLSGTGKSASTQKKLTGAASAPAYNEAADVAMTVKTEDGEKKKKKRKLEDGTAEKKDTKKKKKKKTEDDEGEKKKKKKTDKKEKKDKKSKKKKKEA